MATGKPAGKIIRQRDGLHSVAWSPDGSLLVIGEASGAQMWEVSTGKPFGPPMQHKDWVVAVAFSPDGRFVLTGSQDQTSRLWETATGKLSGEALQHAAAVCDVAFSPDGQTLLTSSQDGMVQRWDRVTGQRLGRPFQRPGSLWAEAALGPDGRTFLMTFGDGTARLGDLVSGRFLGAPFPHFGQVKAAGFSSDARTLLTLVQRRDRHTARLWQIPTPLAGQVDQITCWMELSTGQELDRDGVVHVLNAAALQQRRLRLQQMGSPSRGSSQDKAALATKSSNTAPRNE
jgi:WD40 repeat protein